MADRTRRVGRPLRLILLSAAGAASAVMAQGDAPSPPAIWSPAIRPAPGFPASAAGYERTRISELGYDDWAVSYRRVLPDGWIASHAVVFLFQSEVGCDKEIDRTWATIIKHRPDARDAVRGVAPSPLGKGPTAQTLSFVYDVKSAEGPRPSRSLMYVYCHPGSRWTIKLRMTHDDDVPGLAETAAILRAIRWPAAFAR